MSRHRRIFRTLLARVRDRLFLCLAAGFWIFAINYAVLGVLPLADERRAYAFVLRLVGFVAILIGVVLKDRELVEHLRSWTNVNRATSLG